MSSYEEQLSPTELSALKSLIEEQAKRLAEDERVERDRVEKIIKKTIRGEGTSLVIAFVLVITAFLSLIFGIAALVTFFMGDLPLYPVIILFIIFLISYRLLFLDEHEPRHRYWWLMNHALKVPKITKKQIQQLNAAFKKVYKVKDILKGVI